MKFVPRWMAPPTTHPTSSCRRVLRFLRAKGFDLPEIDDDRHYRIHRVRAGRIQRSHGAWSWHLDWSKDKDPTRDRPSGLSQIGSQWPIRELFKHGVSIYTDRFGDTHLDPVPKDAKVGRSL